VTTLPGDRGGAAADDATAAGPGEAGGTATAGAILGTPGRHEGSTVSEGLYLGRDVNPKGGTPGAPLHLDPADLLTHGLIVGMTGSGKTGLAIVLLEELLRRGVPVLAIDPKGDLTNLLLLFEKLDGASFEPWIDPEAARRDGKTVKDAAAATAATWKQGLAEWGLGSANIAALERARDAVVFTPGSAAGVPLDVLGSLAPPPVPFDEAEEELRDEIGGIVAGLLGLVGADADPLQSREAILLANLIEHGWRSGRGFSLEALIAAVAEPPFEKLGALPVETVYPRKDRQSLMLALNNLLASPGFEAWREGAPLDVEQMLRAPDGRPRLSVVYTAHLGDAERLFVTALVVDKLKTWVRRQSGTGELRALLYVDEIYGYVPPHPANPPTKRPLLTLLKQARAQGVGVVLATQNPVDLDYKGLSNTGTWVVGTLQARQDRERLAEGLTGVGLERTTIDRMLDATRKRVFLLHDVHRKGPALVESRWAMSYLRGPLTRDEVARLREWQASMKPPAPAENLAPTRVGSGGVPPVLPAPFEHRYLPRFGGDLAEVHLLVKYAVRYKDAAESVGLLAWPLGGETPAEALEAEAFPVDEGALVSEAPASLRYAALPDWLSQGASREIEKALRERLPDKLAVTVFRDPDTDQQSVPGESREAFARRLREQGGGRAAEVLRERLEKKQSALSVLRQEVEGRRQEKWLAVGQAVLRNVGLLTGRRRRVTGVDSVLTKNRLEDKAEARLAALQGDIEALEAEMLQITEVDPDGLEEVLRPPVRGGVKVLRDDLVWVY